MASAGCLNHVLPAEVIDRQEAFEFLFEFLRSNNALHRLRCGICCTALRSPVAYTLSRFFRQQIKRSIPSALSSEQYRSTAAPASLVFVTSLHFNPCAEAAGPVYGNLSSLPVFSSTEALETQDIREILEDLLPLVLRFSMDFLSIPNRKTRGNVASAASFPANEASGCFSFRKCDSEYDAINQEE